MKVHHLSVTDGKLMTGNGLGNANVVDEFLVITPTLPRREGPTRNL